MLALVGETRQGQEAPLLAAAPPWAACSPSFVYLAGLTRGLSPASLVWDLPPPGTPPGQMTAYRGPLRLRAAMANDLPGPTRQVFEGMGAALVSQTLRAFGLDPTPPRWMTCSRPKPATPCWRWRASMACLPRRGRWSATRAAFGPAATLDAALDSRRRWPRLPGVERARFGAGGHAPLAYLVNDVLRDAAARESAPLFETAPGSRQTGARPAGGSSGWLVTRRSGWRRSGWAAAA